MNRPINYVLSDNPRQRFCQQDGNWRWWQWDLCWKGGERNEKRKKLNIIDIFLERKDNTVSFNLSKEELSKLLFKKMKIDSKSIVKIDTSAFKSIHIELTANIEPEAFSDLPTFEIRDGLRTKFNRPHHHKDTLLTMNQLVRSWDPWWAHISCFLPLWNFEVKYSMVKDKTGKWWIWRGQTTE